MNAKKAKKIRQACRILDQGDAFYRMVKKDFQSWSQKKQAEFLQIVKSAQEEKEKNDKK